MSRSDILGLRCPLNVVAQLTQGLYSKSIIEAVAGDTGDSP